ncbi:hypothetical protein L2E82_39108 [Cichorium intybus]|uniref:Uncharacterized protein n=1 Tax=Cichorium intybus TaxID=13427 RepID=A0ACB9AHN1_CICIN|nr:hypothetical protein L2E82_39108 [Cichorium intybus]
MEEGNKNGSAPNQSNGSFDRQKGIRVPSVSFVDVVKGGVRDQNVKTEKTKKEHQESIKSEREHVEVQVNPRVISLTSGDTQERIDVLKGKLIGEVKCFTFLDEGDDAEEDEEDNADSEEDDPIEQFDEDESEWGTDLELEEYSGDTVVKESIQFPREKDHVDENTDEHLESDGDGQLPGETKFISTDHDTQGCSSGEEDDLELDEDDDSFVQHTLLENYNNEYSRREREKTDFNNHVGVKEKPRFMHDQQPRDGENKCLLSDKDKCQRKNKGVKDASSREVENIKVMG